MGVRNPQTVPLSLRSYQGRSTSGNYPVPPTSNLSYLFAASYRPSGAALPLSAYWPDTRSKSVVQNYNNAYTGLAWSQPLWGFMGDGPKLYEIVVGPPGMTLDGELSRNARGYFAPTSTSGNLIWTNPIAGDHRIVIRITDQSGRMVVLDWVLTVGTANHHFMALVATGNGSGSSPSNYATWATTILGATTDSPSKGKVLHVKGDDFPAAGSTTSLDSAFMAASVVAMPGESPIFRHKFAIRSSNIHLHGITLDSIPTSSFGVVNIDTLVHRACLWRCKFINITRAGVENANQCCFGMSSLGDGAYRERLFISECEYINCGTLHGYDAFNVRDIVFARNRYTLPNGQSTIDASWIFPKNAVINSEIVDNVADAPSLTTSTVPIAQLHNAWEPLDTYVVNVVCKFENNLIRTGGADCIGSNGSGNWTLASAPSVTFTNYIKRNTFIGGRVTMWHLVTDMKPERISWFESNVIQNVAGGITIPAGGSSSSWYQVSGTNVYGTSGIVDSDCYVIDDTNRGKSGHGIWEPVA